MADKKNIDSVVDFANDVKEFNFHKFYYAVDPTEIQHINAEYDRLKDFEDKHHCLGYMKEYERYRNGWPNYEREPDINAFTNNGSVIGTIKWTDSNEEILYTRKNEYLSDLKDAFTYEPLNVAFTTVTNDKTVRESVDSLVSDFFNNSYEPPESTSVSTAYLSELNLSKEDFQLLREIVCGNESKELSEEDFENLFKTSRFSDVVSGLEQINAYPFLQELNANLLLKEKNANRTQNAEVNHMIATDVSKVEKLADQALNNGKEKVIADNVKVTVTEVKTPYYKQNAEMLLSSIRDGTAPFISMSADENGKVTILPQVIRSAETGHAFKGANQLLAQIKLKELGDRNYRLVTYQQAKRHETYIKKGSPHLTLTTFDVETKKSNFYHYFPVSAVADRRKLPEIKTRKPNAKTVIVCNESDPEKYLGKYLAASAAGVRFETTLQNVQEFRQKADADLEKNFKENRHTRIFTLGNKASEICRDTLKEIARPEQERQLEKKLQYTQSKNRDGGYER